MTKTRASQCRDCSDPLEPDRPVVHGARCPACYRDSRRFYREEHDIRKALGQPNLDKATCITCGEIIGGRIISYYCKAHRPCTQCHKELIYKESATLCYCCYRQTRNRSQWRWKHKAQIEATKTPR